MVRGQRHSPESRAKIGAALLGKKRAPYSPEWRAKISDALTGKKLSPEHRAAIGAGMRARRSE